MRIQLEQRIVKRTVLALLNAGYALQTDIQDDPRPTQPTTDRAAILTELAEVDDEYLGVFTLPLDPADGRPVGWVRFVYGNDGYDVICDYTTNLERVLAPINAYIDTLS